MPGVTISAGYGTGGSRIAQLVADRLELPLLDRAISTEVAAQLRVTVLEAQDAEFSRSFTDRLLGLLAPLSSGVLGAGTDAAPPGAFRTPADAELFREQAETIMRQALAAGAVILGRAGAAAFREEPDVLRVRLYGPTQARIAHAAGNQSITTDVAEQRLHEVDHARSEYVRRLYHVDIDDPDLYSMQLDSTALPEQTCARIISDTYRLLRPLD